MAISERYPHMLAEKNAAPINNETAAATLPK